MLIYNETLDETKMKPINFLKFPLFDFKSETTFLESRNLELF